MMHSLRSVSSGGIVKGVGNQCCQVQHRQGIMAHLLPARARVARICAIVLLLAGCSGSDPVASSSDCGGERWDDVSGGRVACEVSGERCAFSEQFELVPVDSDAAHWVCTCGDPIHLYWCKAR